MNDARRASLTGQPLSRDYRARWKCDGEPRAPKATVQRVGRER